MLTMLTSGKLRLLIAPMLAATLCNSTFAAGQGNPAGGSQTNPKNTTPPQVTPAPPASGATQTSFDTTNNAVIVDIDGQANITGVDHDVEGNPDPNITTVMPAIGLGGIDGVHVDGTGGDADRAGVGVQTGGNAGSQVFFQTTTDTATGITGGVTNNIDPNKVWMIEEFVQSAKLSGIKIDTAGDNPKTYTNGDFFQKNADGSYKVFYASPSSAGNEKEIHLSGQGTGFGVLVVEVNDLKYGGVQLNAQFKWTGLIIVVVNYRDQESGNKTPLNLRGSGNNGDGHLVGGTLIFHRNQEQTGGEVFGEHMADFGGGGTLKYSSAALKKSEVKGAFQVRSWRKIE